MTVAIVIVAAAGFAAIAAVALGSIWILHRWASHVAWTLAAEVHALRRHLEETRG